MLDEVKRLRRDLTALQEKVEALDAKVNAPAPTPMPTPAEPPSANTGEQDQGGQTGDAQA